jgi:hypothetical protein
MDKTASRMANRTVRDLRSCIRLGIGGFQTRNQNAKTTADQKASREKAMRV